MLRAFDSLAQQLNQVAAAKHLGITRQTLRRHMDDLEALYGAKLFTLDGGRRILTKEGIEALPDARDILLRCESWSSGSRYTVRRIDGLEHASYKGPTGQLFFSQQHALGSIHNTGIPVIKEMFAAWGQSLANLGHPALQKFLPYLIVYRRTGTSWTFAEVGELSAYTQWFGLQNALSVRGTTYDDDLAGEEFNTFISRAYSQVYYGGGIRFDHLHACAWSPKESSIEPINFQRLLVDCVFPNGRPALAVLAATTNHIDIDALKSEVIPQVRTELLMDEASVLSGE